MKAKPVKKHATKKAAKPTPEPIPMKSYAEPPAQPVAPVVAAPAPQAYMPQAPAYQPVMPQAAPQPQPAPYQQPYQQPASQGGGYQPRGGIRGQGEFTRITGLFDSRNNQNSASVSLKEDELRMLREVVNVAKVGDKIGVSLDKNGRKFLWFMRK